MPAKPVKTEVKVTNELSSLLKKCNLNQDFNIDDKTSVQNLLIKILKLLCVAGDSTENGLTPSGKKGGKTDGTEGVGGRGDGEGEYVRGGSQSAFQKLEHRVRKNEDFSDAVHQRTVKGNILVFSPENPQKNLKTIITNPEDLEGETYQEQIIRLVHEYYGVLIPKQDIVNCHPTKSGGAIIRFGNRNSNSAFDKLCTAIKTGGCLKKKVSKIESKKGVNEKGENEGGENEGGENEGGENEGGEKGASKKTYADITKINPNFWLSFMLSYRRSDIVRELKQQKKNRKIFKFTSDENGEIYVIKQQGDPKIRLTMDWTKPDDSKTYTKNELLQLLS